MIAIVARVSWWASAVIEVDGFRSVFLFIWSLVGVVGLGVVSPAGRLPEVGMSPAGRLLEVAVRRLTSFTPSFISSVAFCKKLLYPTILVRFISKSLGSNHKPGANAKSSFALLLWIAVWYLWAETESSSSMIAFSKRLMSSCFTSWADPLCPVIELLMFTWAPRTQ